MERKNIAIIALILIIIVLAGILVYTLSIKPAIEKTAEQNVINALLLQLQQQGYVQLYIGNQTIILVPYNSQGSATA